MFGVQLKLHMYVQIAHIHPSHSNVVHKFAVGKAQNGRLNTQFENSLNQLLAVFSGYDTKLTMEYILLAYLYWVDH